MPRPSGKAVADVVAQGGKENLEALADLSRKVADRVARDVLRWRVADGVEDLVGLIVMHAAVVWSQEVGLGEIAAELKELRALRAGSTPEADPAALAESLASTARNLDEHIERRAHEITEPRIAAAQALCDEVLAAERESAGFERERNGDLIKELRRQLNAQVRHVERNHGQWKADRAVIKQVALLMNGFDGYADAREDSDDHSHAGQVREMVAQVRAVLNGETTKQANHD